MNLNEYQTKIKRYDCFEATDDLGNPGFVAKILGLTEEAGEVSGKFKKVLRDDGGKISAEKKEEIEKELGDVLWYVATIARYLGIELEEVAEKNVEKLESRLKRNVLHGAGDNR
ncbi:nucleoside triphosphate pyrophosphohydrolase family protein [Candidatus Saccharibacteria bacterium]|nr:nucleoside triphosphate pyrophosphohydrolase family protein [Candidatus Saccharibacteria bacterium]